MGDGSVYFRRQFEHQYRDTGWFAVTQIIVTPDGCADTAKIPIYVEPEVLLFVPNAFTPNNDGTNDVFSWGVTGAKTFEMIIFSRWGDEVFRTDNPKEFWTGAYRNQGESMQEGIYTWVAHIRGVDNRFHRKTGTVLLSK
jgi:gliding motility-associated-like protein